MTISSIMSSALSGLQTAQTGLTTVSNNIANVNTPGYVREVLNQVPLVTTGGTGVGVGVADIQRAANQFLEGASYNASAGQGQASVVSSLLGQAQAAFGDPSSPTSYFNQLSSVFSAFSAAANTPGSNLSNSQVLGQVATFLDNSRTVASTLSSISGQADTKIANDVGQINQLLSQIDSLNGSISNTLSVGGDPSNSQNAQAQLLTQLSSLIGISVQSNPRGGVVVRGDAGVQLDGPGGPATLSYLTSASANGQISITQQGAGQSSAFSVGTGELGGLLNLRNVQLPGVQSQVAEFVTGAVNAINAAHNASTAFPPPATLTGQNIGTDLATAVSGFTGKTNIAVVDSSGHLQESVAIDFSAGTISVNGGGPSAFTPANFLTSLNTALGAAGSATFSNGVLSLSASAPNTGISIADDATSPSSHVGEGFSQFFGLNNLISSNEITNYNTGLQAASANNFTPGGTISLQINDATGATVRDVTVTVPNGGTIQGLLNALNAPNGGVGAFGQFVLDAKGAVTFTPTTPGSASVAVVSDNTQLGAAGPSLSQYFGIGATQRASRATSFSIRPDISANPLNLATATLDLAAAPGNPVVSPGDGSGALLLSKAGNAVLNFAAAGDLPAMTTSITQYAAQFGGGLGDKAAAADAAKTAAAAVQTQADSARQNAEGVNLDEELTKLTTYQQAYNASARLIQAGKDMFDTLLTMVP
ncbi:MAG: flagellar hook-associated protein FlgK [Caulobacterales bacterium]